MRVWARRCAGRAGLRAGTREIPRPSGSGGGLHGPGRVASRGVAALPPPPPLPREGRGEGAPSQVSWGGPGLLLVGVFCGWLFRDFW